MKKYKQKNIIVDKNNFYELFKDLEVLIKDGVKIVNIEIGDCGDKFFDVIDAISGKRFHFYDKLIVRVKNLPYCLIKQSEELVFFEGDDYEYFKLPKCRKCKYEKKCFGLRDDLLNSVKKNIKEVLDIPREIMIEIEEKCNLNCAFCFNKNTFARHGRNIKNKLSSDYIKQIIDSAVSFGVGVIRFTGGEPLLRKDIWDLARYVKEKNVELRLNTNSLLIDDKDKAKMVSDHFDNILIPFHYIDFYERSLVARKKIKAIKLLRESGTMVLRAGTVATRQLISNFNDIYKIIDNLPIDKWELYRVIATPEDKKSFSSAMLKKIVDKLLEVKNKNGKTHYIVNAIPFCSYDPLKIRQVAIGAEAVDGHERFVIDPRGFAKPLYYIDKNIGDPLDLKACWNHEFMKKMRNLEFVPRGCSGCVFLEKCKGGCRFSANIVNGDYNLPDPLMDIKNKIII